MALLLMNVGKWVARGESSDTARRGRRIDDHADFGNGTGRETAQLRVLANQRFIRRQINAEQFVLGAVRMLPLDRRAEAVEHCVGLLRGTAQLFGIELADTWDIPLDHKTFHG